MSKPPLRDGDGLRQQAGVAMDLVLLAVQAGFCIASDVVGEATPDETRRYKMPRGQSSRVENAMQMQKNVFSKYCWDDGTKNSCGNIANHALSTCLSESKFEG
jgi:hypothetical protein